MSATRSAVHQSAAALRLPNELLLEIFMHGLNAQVHFSESRWERQAVRFLKGITAVCSVWRDTAICYPFLWRRITLARLRKEAYDRISHRLRTFLARSRNITLDIHIDFHKPSSKGTQRLVDILLRHIQRCRTLSLVSHGNWFDKLGPFVELSGPLIHLTNLSVEGATAKSLPSMEFGFALLGPRNIAPLSHLDLHLIHISGIEVSDGLANIRTTSLIWLSIICYDDNWRSDILGFVSRCSKVEHLNLTLTFPEEPVHIEPFGLDNVKHFTDGSSSPYALIHTISMPALEELSIYGEYMSETTETEGALASPRFPHLRRIAFEACEFSDYDVLPLHKLLRANPTIRNIYTEGCFNVYIITIAMLGPLNEREMALLAPELEAFGLSREPSETPHRVVPDLNDISIFEGEMLDYGLGRTDNQAYTFQQVLSQWESVHIYVDDWDSYGGTKSDTQALQVLFGERFSFQGEYPEDL